MNIKSSRLYRVAVAVSALVLPAIALHAQSLYSNAVMSLNPVAYWPLQETTPAPRYDMETNYGSLGSIANAYYASAQALATNVGAISGDSDGCRLFQGSANSFALVPTTDHRVSLSAGQPFTVEMWARATGNNSFVSPLCQTGPNNAGGLNGVNNSSGWSLAQNFVPYRGTGTQNNPAVFSFHVFNNNGFTGGAEIDVSNSAPSMWITGGASGYVNSWVYFCGVFDGTNCWLYMYSTNLSAGFDGTNSTAYQIPITSGAGTAYLGTPTVVSNAMFTPDTWDPILFGATRGLGANPYHGFDDEVAIYTNALTFAQITNHFMSGTNGLGHYEATIMGDNPYMYWRMDAPKWTNPPESSDPTAMNYGSAASSMTNFVTGGKGGNCAVYQPGTLPGVAGPSAPGFGAFTNACAFNGMVGAVDAGYNTLLDPTDVTNNFTLVAWFKGNPMDPGGRWNCLASHSDKSWKAQFNNGTADAYNGVSPQASIPPSTVNINDGKWHMYVLESGRFNGGTNVAIYLDSGLYNQEAGNMNPIPGNSAIDAWIGGAPDSTYAEPANEASYTTAQQYFAGEVAHVAFFTNILTFSQIQSLYFTAQPAPVIVQQPISATVGLNSAFTNMVSVEGQAPFYYQWYTNGVALGGATSPNLVINPVTPSTAPTNYYVVVTNDYGAVTSSVVSLTIVSNLEFAAEIPISYTNIFTLYGGANIGGTNYVGSTPTFAVSVLGAPPIYYQWLTNGVAVGGGTNASLTLTNCQLSSPTNFYCIVTNGFGAVTSMVWSVSYIPAPEAPFPQAVLASQPVGYWRLNETPDNGLGNEGALCTDYESGNNGIYTNVVLANALGGTGYNPVTDPTETSTLFGQVTPAFSGQIQTNIDFAKPVGGNAEFTVAVWANGDANQIHAQAANAGLVTKGHWGAEQFTLDEGASPSDLRFVVRDALTGNYYTANSSVNLGSDALWHYVVGVCDEANSQLLLYVDGVLVGTGTLAAGSGVLEVGPVPIMIGARDSAVAPGGQQFNGFLNDAAIYNYALSSNQIVGLYNSGGIPPFFIREPIAATNIDAGANLVVTPTIGGSPLLSYRWFDLGADSYMAGQTNASLVISNIQANDSYYLTVSNGFGMTNSTQISAIVFSGRPYFYANVQSPFYALLGQGVTNSATVYGSVPLGYHWQFSSNGSNWVNLTDISGKIIGSLTNALAIANAQVTNVGDYQLVVTNSFGATTSTVAPLVISGVLPLSFYNGVGWKANVGASFSSGVLTLTGAGVGNSTYFFQVPQYVGAFDASFTYQAQAMNTYPLADGITFCLQDDGRGASATGSGGGALGFSGIAPSVAFQINIFPGETAGGTANGAGIGLGVDGNLDSVVPTGNVNLTNGLVNVWLNYANGNLAVTLSNELSSATFSTNLVVGDITQVLGSDTAYIGFTGAYGGDNSIQTVQNFQFVSIPPQAIGEAKGNAVIIWPGVVTGYTLQENSSLTTTNWVNVPNAQILTNGVNMVTVPIGSSHEFYRLVLPVSH